MPPASQRGSCATIFSSPVFRFSVASALVSDNGYAPESALLQGYARDLDMAVLLANYSGPSGGYASAGRSAFWAPGGQCVVAAPDDAPCLVWAARGDSGWTGSVAAVAVA